VSVFISTTAFIFVNAAYFSAKNCHMQSLLFLITCWLWEYNKAFCGRKTNA